MNHKQLFTSDANVYTYFDITIDDVKIGRIVMELFTDKAPFTAYNFIIFVLVLNFQALMVSFPIKIIFSIV